MAEKTFKYRHLARVIIETTSPLSIGSGNKTIQTDSTVLRDVNGFPFIPGTTLAGLIRHALPDEKRETLMGNNESGSLLIISDAKLLDTHGEVIDGIISNDDLDAETLKFRQIPIRQHARIDHRGVTERGGKFDEEVALIGTRFCFELELISENNDTCNLKDVLDIIRLTSFRIGSGSRSGFGNVKVFSCKWKTINLDDEKDKDWYLEKSSSLAYDWEGNDYDTYPINDQNWIEYRLELQPLDFILFGSGFGNDNADMTFIQESYIDWSGKSAVVKEREKSLLVPASSVKGAISHRVAFYYNQKKGVFADHLPSEDLSKYVGDNNVAVRTLFGSEGRNGGKKQRGNVLMSDVMQERLPSSSPKVLNHVKIDRFTGGAIDGALFDEAPLYAKEEKISLSFLVNHQSIVDQQIRESFEQALKDICSGMLPLGGGVNRGHGCFLGKIYKNGQSL